MTGVEGLGPEGGPPTRLEAEATLEGVAPGMAAERTDLAWSRSGVALLACGVVVLKGMPTVVGDPSRPAAGLLILGLGAMTWGLGQWNAHQRRTELDRPRPVARWRDMAPTAFGTAGVGLAALFLAIFRPG